MRREHNRPPKDRPIQNRIRNSLFEAWHVCGTAYLPPKLHNDTSLGWAVAKGRDEASSHKFPQLLIFSWTSAPLYGPINRRRHVQRDLRCCLRCNMQSPTGSRLVPANNRMSRLHLRLHTDILEDNFPGSTVGRRDMRKTPRTIPGIISDVSDAKMQYPTGVRHRRPM
jgi:hypothetical protein